MATKKWAVVFFFVGCSLAIAQEKPAVLSIQVDKPVSKVSPTLYGLMTEEINYSYDGGLYAEMVRNRTFHTRWEGVLYWYLAEYGNAQATMQPDRNTGPSQAINHSLGVYSIGDLHTNTVESAFSLLKRGIIGTWHRVSAKHLAAYLDEMTWRFNNRKNPFLFRDTIKRMLNAENLEFKELIAA